MKCHVCLWDFSTKDGKHLIPDIAFWGIFCPWDFYTLNPNNFPSLSSNPGYTLCSQITSLFFFPSGDTQLLCFASEWSNVLPAMVSWFADFGGSAVTVLPPSAPASVPPTTQHSGLSAGPEQLFLGAVLIRHWSSWSENQNKTHTQKRRKKNPNKTLSILQGFLFTVLTTSSWCGLLQSHMKSCLDTTRRGLSLSKTVWKKTEMGTSQGRIATKASLPLNHGQVSYLGSQPGDHHNFPVNSQFISQYIQHYTFPMKLYRLLSGLKRILRIQLSFLNEYKHSTEL